ncbi:protease inhibitor Inh/omp19 family protein [Hoeflea sp. TYP-13]|uniref:protease inhibitor Inh/omp19 family protein n=1 Tax=Hoeflea sp. TYP-13 TaxID=3230023 RepID=UPI0034C5DD9D
MRKCIALITLSAVVAMAGCSRTGFNPRFGQPAPLSPAPIGDVQSGQLSPAGQDFPDAPTTQGPSEQELQQVAANAPEVTRDSMVGRWTISTGGNSCDVFLALTKWTGGYRAASRGCTDQAALISAWDVQGKQVVLNDSSGNQFATLYKSGDKRFDGTTAVGQPISLNR